MGAMVRSQARVWPTASTGGARSAELDSALSSLPEQDPRRIIMGRVMDLFMTFYRTAMKIVGDSSATSLRHMVYDSPTEYMSLFVTICVEVVRLAVCSV